MEESLRAFDRRARAVRRKHLRMAGGYVTTLGRNGVIIQKPAGRMGPWVRSLALGVLASAFIVKVLILADLGPEAYAAKLATLDGNAVERAGGVLMQIDPVSARLAELIAPWLR